MSTRDYFSGCSDQYAAFRPHYPRALFEWLSSQVRAHDSVWDCACGNGQASLDLAEDFAVVHATDLSAQQIANAQPHPRVHYRVATSHASGLPDASVDLVTVAQALHWFDMDRFFYEARRVARDEALLAVWCYGICQLPTASADNVLQDFYSNTVGPYWTLERRMVETGYETVIFPTPELVPPRIAMRVEWTLEQLLGYVSSWSATSRYIKEEGHDPIAILRAELRPHWGGPSQRRPVQWPLAIRAARLNCRF